MPYVSRINGVINGDFPRLQPGNAEEFVADDDPEFVQYLAGDPDAKDTNALNRALAQDGSVVRALAEILFERDTAMTTAIQDATNLASLKRDFPKPVTRQQFIQALKNKMRS